MRDVNSSTVTLPRSVSVGIGSSIVTNRGFTASVLLPLLAAETVERVFCPKVDFPFGKGWRGEGIFVQIVLREDFPISACLQHGDLAGLADHVDLVIGSDGRS